MKIDDRLAEQSKRLENAYEIEDICETLASTDQVHSPGKWMNVKKGSSSFRLEKKYGADIKEVLAYAESSKLALERLESGERDKEELLKRLKSSKKT